MPSGAVKGVAIPASTSFLYRCAIDHLSMRPLYCLGATIVTKKGTTLLISYSSVPEALTLTNGYSIAGFNIVRSLQKLGHKVPYQDPAAPVEIHWSNPDEYRFSSPNQYKILMGTWESYPIPARWRANFDLADEVWTTNPVMANWFSQVAGRDVKAYEHGVDGEIWSPRERRVTGGKIKFLHDGEPSPRKNGQMALDAFRAAFGDRTDVHLTIKALGMNTTRVDNHLLPDKVYKNVTIDKSIYPNPEDLATVYARNHVLVCNSEAEGFGLPGLQGIASGMITLCNPGWASYKQFIIPELRLKSTFGPALHQNVVPGKAFPVDFDDLVERYRYVADNFESLSALAFYNAPRAIATYDWVKLTEKAFAPVLEKVDNNSVTTTS
jgi:glycosyltransferase involved in cell wall biosynthesis